MSFDTCPVCGKDFKVGEDVTSDYDDSIVHFACGPDAPKVKP